MARIVYRDENYQTFYVDVNAQQTEVTIGRNPGNKIVIQSKSLSRYHAKIVFQNGHYYLIDLKSSNGSFVNNQRITQQEIHPGEKLRFGEVTVDFIDEMRPNASSPNNAPQMNMPGLSNRPPLPSAPAAPKLMAPQLQPLQHAATNQPDLRSVNLRPITTQGTYRPTMPNQPIFDDEMARVAASQLASNAPSPQNPVLAANVPPMGFNPNSMGMPPSLRVNPNNRPLTPPVQDANADFNAQNPNNLLDPAAPPRGFNPNSMGMPPSLRVNPNNRPLTPPVQDANADFNAQNPNNLLDPAVPPLGFNPNSMEELTNAPVNPNNRPLTPPVQDANADFNAQNPNNLLDPAVPPLGFNPNSMGELTNAPVNPNNRPLTPPVQDANADFNAQNPNNLLDPAVPPLGFNPNSMGEPPQTSIQAVQEPQVNNAFPSFGMPDSASVQAPSVETLNGGPNAQNYSPLNPVALQNGLPVNVSLPGSQPQTPLEDQHSADDISHDDASPQRDDAQSHDSSLDDISAKSESNDRSDNARAASQELPLQTSAANRSSANHGRIVDAPSSGRATVTNRRRATADNISVAQDAAANRRPARATNFSRAQVNDVASQHMHAPAPAMRTGRPPMPRQRVGAPFASRDTHDAPCNRPENRTGTHLGVSEYLETERPKDPILTQNADVAVDNIQTPPSSDSDATPSLPGAQSSENVGSIEENAQNIEANARVDLQQPDSEEDNAIENHENCLSPDENAIDDSPAQVEQNHQGNPSLDETPQSYACDISNSLSEQNSGYMECNEQNSAEAKSSEQNIDQAPRDEQNSKSQSSNELTRDHQLALESLKAERDALLAERDAQNDAHKNEINALLAERDALLAERDAQNDAHKNEIDALLAERDAQNDAHKNEIDALKAKFEQEIDTNQTTFELELSEAEENARNLQDELDSVNAQLQAASDELQKLKKDTTENSKNDAARALIPKWQSRFNALLQYAKVFERAVDKLDVARAEPKSTEYVRSMIDMIRFCADDLNQS